MSDDANLTVPSYVVLGLVSALGEATPYDMKRLASVSLDNFRAVRHSQFYTEPDRLVDAGMLTVEREAAGRRRKHYSITPAGAEALADWLEQPAEMVSELRDEGILKIFFGADPVKIAENRRELHARKLAEFERLLEVAGPLMNEGQRLALRLGIIHESSWVEKMGGVISGETHGRP